MNKDLFSLREEEIFKTLNELKKLNFVVIGGYAVNTYTLPRFSTDCDIVIQDENDLNKIQEVLLRIGYELKTLPEEVPYSGNFCRYEKKIQNDFAVSIDILIKNVADRMTSVIFSSDWIFKNSKMRILRGKTINQELMLRIINLDALIIMKIISCRATDIRDVFMLLPYTKNKKWVKSEITLRYDFQERLSKIIEKADSKQFRDGLSGVYGKFDSKTFEKHKKELFSLQSK